MALGRTSYISQNRFDQCEIDLANENRSGQ